MVAVRLHPEKVSSESIADISALCKALDIAEADLAAALALSPSERYLAKEVPKSDGTPRTVHNPHYLIRRIQRRLNTRIFACSSVVKWPDFVFGSVPNDTDPNNLLGSRDYVNCARQHCGSKSILSIDIKDFFDNIHIDLVKSLFTDFLKYPEKVAEVLANICCKGDRVIQGALTSSYIATLCLFRTEGHLVKKLQHKGLVYTRLVDDITVSSRVSGYDFSYALRQLEQLTSDAGLPLNLQKTKIQHAGMAPLMVHGLRVDFAEPRLPPDEPKRIRASVKNLELLAAGPGYRASRAFRKDFNRCMGRVNKLQRVKHSQYPGLLDRMRKILPLPSHKDIDRAQRLIERLKRDFETKPNYKDSLWFRKRYFIASERLGILKRSFPKTSEELRKLLRPMRPPGSHE